MMGMGAKAGLEYETRHVELAHPNWGDECPELTRAINGMAGKGWALVSLTIPSTNCAILVFSRPRAGHRASGGAGA